MAPKRCFSGLTLVALCSTALAEAYAPIEQERSISVSASAYGGGPAQHEEHSAQAAGYEPFDEEVLAHTFCCESIGRTPGPAGQGDADASQVSEFRASSLVATGFASAENTWYGGGSASAEAESSFRAVVVLATPRQYHITIQCDADFGAAEVFLEGVDGPLHGLHLWTEPIHRAAHQTQSALGVLGPGAYTLTASAQTPYQNLEYLGRYARFSVTLTFCPTDIDGDGTTGPSDLAQLLGAWGPCDPDPCAADIDTDGQVDSADLALLLGAWGACP